MTPSPANIITRRDPWQTVWRIAAGDRLLAAGATGLAILLAAAALLPQSPPAGSAAYARWLSDTQLRFGGAAGVLSAVGLFDVVHAIVFRIFAGVLGLSLAARLVDRIRDFHAASRPQPLPDAAARWLEAGQPGEVIVRRLRGYRLRRGARDRITVADRFPWAHLASIAAHAGPLVMLIGLALSLLTDWRVDGLSVRPGAQTAIPNTPYSLRISGIDSGGSVHLTVLQDDLPIAEGVAAPGRPLAAGGVSLFVRDLLPALRARGYAADGRSLKLQASAQDQPADELLLTFDADRPEAFFVVAPDARLAVRVSLAGPGDERAYRVSVIRGVDAGPLADAVLHPGERIEADGSRFEFGDESHAVFAIVRAPSQAVAAAGGIIGVVGLACVALYPARRIWIATGERGARVMCDDPEFDLSRLTAAGRSP